MAGDRRESSPVPSCADAHLQGRREGIKEQPGALLPCAALPCVALLTCLLICQPFPLSCVENFRFNASTCRGARGSAKWYEMLGLGQGHLRDLARSLKK